MDVSKTQLIESVFAGAGEMGARMRAVDGRRPCWAPWSSGRSRCEVACVSCWAPGIRCSFPGGPDYTKLYNDAYGVVVGTKHPGALGGSCREVLAEAWDFIGPRFDTVFTEGQPISTLTHQLFTFHRKVGFPFVCRDASASGQLYRRLARPMGTGEHYRSMGERHQGG